MPLASALPARLPFSSGGNTYYVNSSTGDDSRTAVQAQNPATPWLTIGQAIDTVPLTGSVVICEGTFESGPNFSSFAIEWTKTGNVSNPVTIKAHDNGCTIVNSGGAGSGPAFGAWIYGPTCSGLRLEGIEFNVRGDGGAGVLIEDGATKIEIYRCRFIENGGGAGSSRGRTAGLGPSTYLRWEACEFGTSDASPITFNGFADQGTGIDLTDHYYRTQGTHFLYLGGESGDDQQNNLISGTEYEVVSNCIFYGSVPGNHVQCGPQFRNGFIVNNTFYYNKMRGGNVCTYPGEGYCEYYAENGVRMWDEGGTYKTQDLVVANNVIQQMGGHAVGGSGGGGTIRRYVFNNIGYQCDNGYNHDGPTNDTFHEFYSTARIYYETKPDGSAASNIVEDPLLNEPTTRDWDLSSGSPAAYLSIPEYTPTTDFNGNSRSPSTPSLGAIEFGGPQSPIAGQGYVEVYRATGEDIFNDLGTNNTWADRDFWQSAPPVGAITLEDETLQLTSRRSDSYPNITVASLNLTTLANSLVFRKGYFEAQLRWTEGHGAWPGFWLFSHAGAMGLNNASLLASELDIFEGQGSEPTEFTGSLHYNSAGQSGVADAVSVCTDPPSGSPDLTDTHLFAAVWTDTTVSWYVDNQFLCSVPTFNSTDQDMYLLFSMWIGGWATDNCIDCNATTPDDLTLEIDYVSVWQQPEVPAGAPVSVVQPSFSGTPTEGNVLTAGVGSWTGAATIIYAYQWQRCDSSGGSCVDIGAATSATYTLVNADVGSTIRVEITATNGDGSTVAYSAASAIVGGRTGTASPPVNLTLPTIIGTPRVGRTLSATTGTWTSTSPTVFTYQWRRCTVAGSCSDIGGATNSTYVPTTNDIGFTLRVRVTATN